MLGILGGGQLGRMLAQAAIRMGLRVRTLSPKPAGPVEGLGHAMVGDWTDPEVLKEFARGCAAITVESEWAPAEHLEPLLSPDVRLYPTPATLKAIRHKGRQNAALAEAGLPVPGFRLCATPADARAAGQEFGYPLMMKRYQGSYDGYGNATARKAADIQELWPKLAGEDGLLVEQFVEFRQELSILVVRRETGQAVAYPAAYTEQRKGRCHAVVVPAEISERTARAAERIARAAADAVGTVGVLGVELFETSGGDILINELAPRPHNTGHYSIEGSQTSQFENHLRAVMGWPLGNPGLRAPVAVMINILGTRSGPVSLESLPPALEVSGAAIHIYGKKEARPERKMGHVTATGTEPAEVRQRAEQAASLVIL